MRQSRADFGHYPSKQHGANGSSRQASEPASQSERFHAHFAFLAHSAPPMPPAIEGEGYEEYLQQSVGEQACAIEDVEVDEVRDQHERPADEQTARGEPDAEESCSEARGLKPICGEVVDDCRPVHRIPTS